jgi:hypothetical protein
MALDGDGFPVKGAERGEDLYSRTVVGDRPVGVCFSRMLS